MEKTNKKSHSKSSQINGLLLLYLIHLLFASSTMHYFMYPFQDSTLLYSLFLDQNLIF